MQGKRVGHLEEMKTSQSFERESARISVDNLTSTKLNNGHSDEMNESDKIQMFKTGVKENAPGHDTDIYGRRKTDSDEGINNEVPDEGGKPDMTKNYDMSRFQERARKIAQRLVKETGSDGARTSPVPGSGYSVEPPQQAPVTSKAGKLTENAQDSKSSGLPYPPEMDQGSPEVAIGPTQPHADQMQKESDYIKPATGAELFGLSESNLQQETSQEQLSSGTGEEVRMEQNQPTSGLDDLGNKIDELAETLTERGTSMGDGQVQDRLDNQISEIYLLLEKAEGRYSRIEAFEDKLLKVMEAVQNTQSDVSAKMQEKIEEIARNTADQKAHQTLASREDSDKIKEKLMKEMQNLVSEATREQSNQFSAMSSEVAQLNQNFNSMLDRLRVLEVSQKETEQNNSDTERVNQAGISAEENDVSQATLDGKEGFEPAADLNPHMDTMQGFSDHGHLDKNDVPADALGLGAASDSGLNSGPGVTRRENEAQFEKTIVSGKTEDIPAQETAKSGRTLDASPGNPQRPEERSFEGMAGSTGGNDLEVEYFSQNEQPEFETEDLFVPASETVQAPASGMSDQNVNFQESEQSQGVRQGQNNPVPPTGSVSSHAGVNPGANPSINSGANQGLSQEVPGQGQFTAAPPVGQQNVSAPQAGEYISAARSANRAEQGGMTDQYNPQIPADMVGDNASRLGSNDYVNSAQRANIAASVKGYIPENQMDPAELKRLNADRLKRQQDLEKFRTRSTTKGAKSILPYVVAGFVTAGSLFAVHAIQQDEYQTVAWLAGKELPAGSTQLAQAQTDDKPDVIATARLNTDDETSSSVTTKIDGHSQNSGNTGTIMVTKVPVQTVKVNPDKKSPDQLPIQMAENTISADRSANGLSSGDMVMGVAPQPFMPMGPEVTASVGKQGEDLARSVASARSPKDLMNLMPPAKIGPVSLRQAAANGHSVAQFEIATRYHLGRGVAVDKEAAVKWMKLSADGGFIPAQYRMGTFYERGIGVTKDLVTARSWYRKAAQGGNVKAMHNLGVIYAGQKKADYALAADWFLNAANRGLNDSQFNLAILYENGLGVGKSSIQAYKWYATASKAGDANAKEMADKVAKKLSATNLIRARREVVEWKPKEPDPKANLKPGQRINWQQEI